MLFPTSIRENLTYGKAKTTIDESRLIDACKMCQIHDFIESLPSGYDTSLADQTSLSGGQRQRIAIARTLVCDTPPVLILDEATSALDNVTERALQNSLYEKLRSKCIMIVIAHRMETIRNADVIMVMDKGQIVETGKRGRQEKGSPQTDYKNCILIGNHEQLMQIPHGRYRKLVSGD